MPVTPFLGLSVFVHLSIILYYRVTHRKGSDKAILGKAKIIKKNRGIFAFSIFVTVFTVVAVNAGLLVNASILDKHSSIRIVDHFISQINAPVSSPNQIVKDKINENFYIKGVNGLDQTNIALNDR